MRAALLLTAVLLAAGCDSGTVDPPVVENPFTCADGTLSTADITVGTGATATQTSVVRLTYVGKLQNGTQFDSRSTADEYDIAQAIVGIREGVAGMKVGGTRSITIPPNLGYGTQTPNSIPECSTLVYEVTLVAVVR